MLGGNLIFNTDDRLIVGLLGPGGNKDVFVIGMNADFNYRGGNHWGGASDEFRRELGVDTNGNVYISGETSSINLPVTAGPASPKCPSRHRERRPAPSPAPD